MKRNNIICLFLLSLLMISIFVSSVNSSDEDDGYEELEEEFTTNKDVKQRNLVRENITPKQILNNYNKYYKNVNKRSILKQNGNNNLAYITPWNRKGYEVSIKFANKFTHLSPVWYQIKFENGKFLIEGDHNIDKDWMNKVKDNSNQKTKIIPRFSFEGQGWSKSESFQKTFIDNSKFIDSLLKIIKDNSYDGLVLEGISHVNRQTRDQFLIDISEKFHLNNKEVFLVISPLRQKEQVLGFDDKDFEKLSNYIDGFSLMTYDFSPSNSMNSPLLWCEENLKYFLGSSSTSQSNSKKIYMGIPFYGYKNDGDAIVGSQFIDILKENKNGKFKWNTLTHEHIFNYKCKKTNNQVSIVYPSLLFIDQHINLSIQYKVSISIWEIGQGLDFNYDLL